MRKFWLSECGLLTVRKANQCYSLPGSGVINAALGVRQDNGRSASHVKVF